MATDDDDEAAAGAPEQTTQAQQIREAVAELAPEGAVTVEPFDLAAGRTDRQQAVDGAVLTAMPAAPERRRIPAQALPAAGDQVFEDRFDHDEWHRLNKYQLGVEPKDTLGHAPGMSTASRLYGAQAWKPVDGEKHVLVGRVDRYAWYNPSVITTKQDEADFNIFIAPTDTYRHILHDVIDMASVAEQKEFQRSADGSRYVVECEVTPDEEYYDNRWFPGNDDDESPMVGSTIGLYGMWIRDLGHGGRPEIHPAECIWWRNRSVSAIAASDTSATFRCIVLQDDSNRFDRPSDYAGPVSRPWSASPRRCRFTFAVLGIRGQEVRYDIAIADGRRVFSWPDEQARTVVKTAPGDTAVSVRKRMTDPSNAKVRLTNLSPDPDQPWIYHAFLLVEVQVGEGDRGEEGFLEFTVKGSRIPSGASRRDQRVEVPSP